MKLAYLFRNTNVFYSIENIFRQVTDEIASRPGYECERWTVPLPGLNIRSLLGNVSFVQRLSADLYHVTGDVHYLTLFLPRKRTVLTIHDCGFVHQNKGIKKWALKKLLLDWPVARCRLITTVSEQTKQDIIRLTGCPGDKIVVIPNPVSKKITASTRPFNPGNPVLLFIGITPNKNLPLLIESIRGIPCTLDIIGILPEPVVEKLKANNIVYRNSFNLSDEEIANKYRDSDLILFPSLFEGFGMPIIEGQRAGRAVITSDLAPMNEVAGGAACLVDPSRASSIREGLLKVISDDTYREELIRKGFLNAERFSPGKIADRYLDSYQKIRIG